jgi:hypothetical protein
MNEKYPRIDQSKFVKQIQMKSVSFDVLFLLQSQPMPTSISRYSQFGQSNFSDLIFQNDDISKFQKVTDSSSG